MTAALFTGANFYGQQRALFSIGDQLRQYMNGLTSRQTYNKQRIAGKTPDPFAVTSVAAAIAERLKAIDTTPEVYGRYMDALQVEDMTVAKLARVIGKRRKAVAEQLAKFSDAGFVQLAGTKDGDFYWRWVE